MTKPRTAPGHIGDMMIRRIMYDRMRYKVIHEYMERRKQGLERARDHQYDELEKCASFCEQRGEFWLEVVRRDINRDLDAMKEALLDVDENDDEFLFDSMRRASDDGKRSAFSKSPDFLSSFDIFRHM